MAGTAPSFGEIDIADAPVGGERKSLYGEILARRKSRLVRSRLPKSVPFKRPLSRFEETSGAPMKAGFEPLGGGAFRRRSHVR